jgi:inorganic triphosphatase YgiF
MERRREELLEIDPFVDRIKELLYCPLSLGLIKDPVILSDGITYEKQSILQWLRQSNKSPFTREQLQEKISFKNYAAFHIIDLIQKRGALIAEKEVHKSLLLENSGIKLAKLIESLDEINNTINEEMKRT